MRMFLFLQLEIFRLLEMGGSAYLKGRQFPGISLILVFDVTGCFQSCVLLQGLSFEGDDDQ
jgi:hypothetical protein